MHDRYVILVVCDMTWNASVFFLKKHKSNMAASAHSLGHDVRASLVRHPFNRVQDLTPACGIPNAFFNVVLGIAVVKNCVPLAPVDEVFQVLFETPSNANDRMNIALNSKLNCI